jgi:bifunctional enzyme CysN/CysC
MEQLRIVIVGHVDHGKSTLVGRLFHDCGLLPEGRLAQLEKAAERRGVAFEWANLTDALQAERDQNISIETSQIWFRTPNREYVIIDAPGHREFLKNMVTGACSADAALLLIDAAEGVRENSRRHGYLLNLLGIPQVMVLVNKMDLVGYDEQRFQAVESEYRQWLASIELKVQTFIPISARDGDNLVKPGNRMPWYHGPTVVEALNTFTPPKRDSSLPLRYPIQDVYRQDGKRVLAGRIESGSLRVGDRLWFTPSEKSSVVKSIERWQSAPSDTAVAGESIGVTLAEQIFVERGAIASHKADPPYVLTSFKARVFWMGRAPLVRQRRYRLKLTTQESDCEIASIEKVIDASSLDLVDGNSGVAQHQVAELVLHCSKPIAFDPVTEVVPTGRFVIVDGAVVAGGGVVLPDTYPRRTHQAHVKSENLYWSPGKISAADRTARNRHPGMVVWLTGLSCSGKSTIARELERELFNQGQQVYVIDGDNLRHGLCSDLGFAEADRQEHMRRVGELAKLFADAGVICIVALIGPYRALREAVRNSMPPGRFIEVLTCQSKSVSNAISRASTPKQGRARSKNSQAFQPHTNRPPTRNSRLTLQNPH